MWIRTLGSTDTTMDGPNVVIATWAAFGKSGCMVNSRRDVGNILRELFEHKVLSSWREVFFMLYLLHNTLDSMLPRRFFSTPMKLKINREKLNEEDLYLNLFTASKNAADLSCSPHHHNEMALLPDLKKVPTPFFKSIRIPSISKKKSGFCFFMTIPGHVLYNFL